MSLYAICENKISSENFRIYRIKKIQAPWVIMINSFKFYVKQTTKNYAEA